MRVLISLISLITFISCSSRSFERDYRVVDASSEDIPEWVEDLDEWLDDEEEDYNKNKYYLYTTEAKNSRSTACEIAKARSTSAVASEISTFIKQSFAQSKSGDPTKIDKKLSEYIQDDLVKEVQSFIIGARSYKTYWEKRRFMKDEGAKKDWDGYICTSLVKISKENLKKAFQRTEDLLASKADKNVKIKVQELIKEASEAYTKIQ